MSFDNFPSFYARKVEVQPWHQWFAWRPVKILNKRVWLKQIYRRQIITYVDTYDWIRYEYATIFDILKQNQ
jgi:hypothetical protein